MKLGILVAGHIDAPHVDKYGNYARMFQQLFSKVGADFEYDVFYVCDEQWPSLIGSCDAWLITGSASGVYDNKPWMQTLKKWIIHSYEQGTPMVGICFGHQIIAEAFAGKVEKFTGGWSVGPQTYTLHNMSLEDKTEITLNAVHQDQVINKPLNSRCMASSSFCKNAMLLYGQTILTIQAHPEFTHEYEAELLVYHQGKAIDQGVAQEALGLMKNQDIIMDDLIIAHWMVSILTGRESNLS